MVRRQRRLIQGRWTFAFGERKRIPKGLAKLASPLSFRGRDVSRSCVGAPSAHIHKRVVVQRTIGGKTTDHIVMLHLKSTTDRRWLAEVDVHLDEMLIDHWPHREKKAAGTAMN